MQEIAILISTVAGTCTAAAIRKYRINKIKTPIIGANRHIKNQLHTLQVEKQVLTKSISRLYQDDVGLTPIQRDRVLLKYQHRLAIILSRIEKLEQVSKHPDLGPLGDGLVTLMDQKLSQLDQRLYELTSKIKISDKADSKSDFDSIVGKRGQFGQSNQQNVKERIELSTLTTIPKTNATEQKSTKIDAMLEELRKDVITPPKPRYENKPQTPIVKETREEVVQKPEIIIASTPTISKPDTIVPKPEITTNEQVKPQPIQLPKDIEIDEDNEDENDDDITKIKDKILKTLESLDQTEVD